MNDNQNQPDEHEIDALKSEKIHLENKLVGINRRRREISEHYYNQAREVLFGLDSDRTEAAKILFLKSLNADRNENNTTDYGYFLETEGEFDLAKKYYNEALSYLKTLVISKQVVHKIQLAKVQLLLSKFHIFCQKDERLSLKYAKDCLMTISDLYHLEKDAFIYKDSCLMIAKAWGLDEVTFFKKILADN